MVRFLQMAWNVGHALCRFGGYVAVPTVNNWARLAVALAILIFIAIPFSLFGFGVAGLKGLIPWLALVPVGVMLFLIVWQPAMLIAFFAPWGAGVRVRSTVAFALSVGIFLAFIAGWLPWGSAPFLVPWFILAIVGYALSRATFTNNDLVWWMRAMFFFGLIGMMVATCFYAGWFDHGIDAAAKVGSSIQKVELPDRIFPVGFDPMHALVVVMFLGVLAALLITSGTARKWALIIAVVLLAFILNERYLYVRWSPGPARDGVNLSEFKRASMDDYNTLVGTAPYGARVDYKFSLGPGMTFGDMDVSMSQTKWTFVKHRGGQISVTVRDKDRNPIYQGDPSEIPQWEGIYERAAYVAVQVWGTKAYEPITFTLYRDVAMAKDAERIYQ